MCKGRWINHAKYGYQFEVDSYRLELSEEEKGIIEFLSKFVRGVGEVTATRVVEEFGNNTYNVIINKPEDLLAIGITETKARAMHKAMLERKKYEELFSFLIPLGWSHEDIFFIYKNLGYYAIEKIKKNPYILCNYKELEFEKVDNLAKHLGFNENNLERLKQSIMIYISRQVDGNGDMFVYKKNIIREVPDFLDASGAFKETKLDQLEDAIEELVISKKIVIEKDNNGEECVYIRFYAHIENSIAKKISRMIRQKPTTIPTKEMIEVSIKQYESNQGLKLASGQKNAIFMCLENKLSILNGGPGTGKSQTIDAIIACIKEVQPGADIQLCAPTGRAAKRMTELTGMEAKTIHRLIGLNNFKQDRKELIEIEADFLIIDEASMIDAYVFYSLLSAISSHTKILIVGDYEQLPSVGAGLILRDLINSEVIPYYNTN